MKHNSILKHARDNFFTGLAIVMPAIISIGMLYWIFGTVSNFTDMLLIFVPSEWTHKPNDGPMYWYWSLVAFTLAVFLVILVGRLARYYLGKKAIEWVDYILMQVPLLNKIYGTVKQVNEALSNNKSSFKQVVLIPFPQPEMRSLGFITGEQKPLTPGAEKLMCVFVPTTPNPTSGFLVMVPDSQITRLDMPVAEGIKFIISLGSVAPQIASARLAAVTVNSDHLNAAVK